MFAQKQVLESVFQQAFEAQTLRMKGDSEATVEKSAQAEAEIQLDSTSAVKKSGEMKAVEASLAEKLLAKLETAGCDKNALSGEVSTLKALHEKVLRFEVDNAITSLVRPSVDAVGRVLEVIGTPGAVVYPSASGYGHNGNVVINNNVGGGKAEAKSTTTAPKASAPAAEVASTVAEAKEEAVEETKKEVKKAVKEAKDDAKDDAESKEDVKKEAKKAAKEAKEEAKEEAAEGKKEIKKAVEEAKEEAKAEGDGKKEIKAAAKAAKEEAKEEVKAAVKEAKEEAKAEAGAAAATPAAAAAGAPPAGAPAAGAAPADGAAAPVAGADAAAAAGDAAAAAAPAAAGAGAAGAPPAPGAAAGAPATVGGAAPPAAAGIAIRAKDIPENSVVLQMFNGKSVLVPPTPESSSWSDDIVALQVNGSPIYVNPESELDSNEVAAVPMIPLMDLGENRTSLIVGPDDVTVLQLTSGRRVDVYDTL
jgi:hypothetical protein